MSCDLDSESLSGRQRYKLVISGDVKEGLAFSPLHSPGRYKSKCCPQEMRDNSRSPPVTGKDGAGEAHPDWAPHLKRDDDQWDSVQK